MAAGVEHDGLEPIPLDVLNYCRVGKLITAKLVEITLRRGSPTLKEYGVNVAPDNFRTESRKEAGARHAN
jgi:hypothetical protein